MRREVTLARTASETVMGMQVYEQAIDSRADEAVAALPRPTRLYRTVVRSLRSPLAGTRRLPAGVLQRMGPRTRPEVGRWLYPGRGPVHRMDLTLPPSPRGDIVTVHDIAPLRYPDEGTFPPAARTELLRAAAVITVSQFSADEIAEHFGVVPIVIPNGVDHARFANARRLSCDELDALGVKGPYVLAAGGASQRKNLEGLARAWPMIRSSRPDLTLVLTGPPHPRRDGLFAPLAGAIRVGRVADETLPRLLAGASALVMPSLYEGYGLPAVEGMAAGVPVVATDASALPEVLGETGVLVGRAPESLAEGVIWAVDGGPEIRAKVQAARARSLGMSWERAAARHAQVWDDVISRTTAQR